MAHHRGIAQTHRGVGQGPLPSLPRETSMTSQRPARSRRKLPEAYHQEARRQRPLELRCEATRRRMPNKAPSRGVGSTGPTPSWRRSAHVHAHCARTWPRSFTAGRTRSAFEGRLSSRPLRTTGAKTSTRLTSPRPTVISRSGLPRVNARIMPSPRLSLSLAIPRGPMATSSLEDVPLKPPSRLRHQLAFPSTTRPSGTVSSRGLDIESLGLLFTVWHLLLIFLLSADM